MTKYVVFIKFCCCFLLRFSVFLIITLKPIATVSIACIFYILYLYHRIYSSLSSLSLLLLFILFIPSFFFISCFLFTSLIWFFCSLLQVFFSPLRPPPCSSVSYISPPPLSLSLSVSLSLCLTVSVSVSVYLSLSLSVSVSLSLSFSPSLHVVIDIVSFKLYSLSIHMNE